MAISLVSVSMAQVSQKCSNIGEVCHLVMGLSYSVSVQITAPAYFKGELKKITVEFTPFRSELQCFEYDATSTDMSGKKSILASIRINEQSYPQFFKALSALESWRSYFYFNYFFSWDKITKSGWRDLTRTGHKDGPLGRDNQRFYNLYQMMIAILRAETGIDLSVPDNPSIVSQQARWYQRSWFN